MITLRDNMYAQCKYPIFFILVNIWPKSRWFYSCAFSHTDPVLCCRWSSGKKWLIKFPSKNNIYLCQVEGRTWWHFQGSVRETKTKRTLLHLGGSTLWCPFLVPVVLFLLWPELQSAPAELSHTLCFFVHIWIVCLQKPALDYLLLSIYSKMFI